MLLQIPGVLKKLDTSEQMALTAVYHNLLRIWAQTWAAATPACG